MKRAISLMTVVSSLLTIAVLLSFSGKKGGDILEIYAGGKQVLQQFIHADGSVKTIELNLSPTKENIEVIYTHCGVTGKNRVLALRDEKNNLLKEFKFDDVTTKRDPMSISLKEAVKKGGNHLRLFYTSRELPEGRLLAKMVVKTEKLAMN